MPPSFGQSDRASTSASTAGRQIVATDGELLYLATKRSDSAALEELFARHADMVWHVCQQVLWREADAEDAFQATFLILLRRAAAIRASDSVAAWLYRVAYRTALAARRRRHKRKTEPLTGEPPAPEVEYPDLESRYITGILLEELSALPQKYQKALVLRYLEGRSRREIADQTDLTIAAVQGYLARGKQLLRGRLLRRGVLLSTGMAMLTTTRAASAAPAAMIASNVTLGAAVASGAAGALAKISTSTLQLVDQGARSMFLSTMMAKPVVWVAVAFAVAGVTASHSPGGGAPQEGVVLSAEVAGGDEAGVIQLTEAEAPAKSAGEGQLVERPVEKPRVEERRIEKPVESPAPQKKLVYETRIVNGSPVTVAREITAPFDPEKDAAREKLLAIGEFPVEKLEVMQKMMELQKQMLALQRERVAQLKQAAKMLGSGSSEGESVSREFQLHADVMEAEVMAIQMELQTLQLQQSQIQILDAVNKNVLVPTGWGPPPAEALEPMPAGHWEVEAPKYAEPQPQQSPLPTLQSGQSVNVIWGGLIENGRQVNSSVELYIQPDGSIEFKPFGKVVIAGMTQGAAKEAVKKMMSGMVKEVKVDLIPGGIPRLAWSNGPVATANDRALYAAGPHIQPTRSVLEKPGTLTPGQTIQIEIYSETASAELEQFEARGGVGSMGSMLGPEHSTRSFTIEPMGTIAFGAKYGRVKVAGMTLEAAEEAIAEKLREQVPDVKVQITLPHALPFNGPMTTSP